MVLFNTVHYNISKYSECDYTRYLLAQKLQYKIAFPIHRHPVKILKDKVHMLNCPLNRDDVKGPEDIWGKPGIPERENLKTKNATHQRVNFTHPYQYPKNI